MNKRFLILFFGLMFISVCVQAQVWQADNGDGTYRNPIIHADYSDPDVIRVGDDYYMIASSFTCFPGIPLLHSKDLVNWKIVNHIYTELPFDRYKYPAHGQGSWAPSIRYHKGRFYVYFCTPEEGLFVAYTDDLMKKWTLKHVLQVSLWEDPCPFWDDNGEAYLVRSKLCGGPAYLHRMSEDGLTVLDNGRVVYWDNKENPTLEGLKMMKRNGYYYILAPAGGVSTGWQTVLRSKDIYGPYEAKKVLKEGNGVNGPHQGGLVETQTGEWWFIHFQDKGVYGRIAHLQPARWINDWPIIGIDENNEGCGLPVLTYKKPNVGATTYPVEAPQTTDEFTDATLGLQWQWQAMAQKRWYSLTENPGSLRLYPMAAPTDQGNLHYSANLLLQKFPAPAFSAVTKLKVSGLKEGKRAGLLIMGGYHTYLSIEKNNKENKVILFEGKGEVCGFPPHALYNETFTGDDIWLKVTVSSVATCRYSYSLDGKQFREFSQELNIEKGHWIGAKVGLFCINPEVTDGKGFVDVDYFRID